MKINEIICENDDMDQDATLADTLMFIKNNGMTEIETLALISMVQRNGLDGFSYQALLDANENDPMIKSMLKSIDPRKIKLAADTNQVVNNPGGDEGGEDQRAAGENVVGNMAKRGSSL